MDKLEKYITENRSELDRHTPDPDIWNRIDHGKSGRSVSIRTIANWAAIIAVLVTSTLLIYSNIKGNPAGVTPELLESELYYSQKVDKLLNEARPYLSSYPAINEDIMFEISNLDSLYLEIRKDLKDNISNDEVIEALIMNYRIKIQILEEMLGILKEGDTKNEKIISHEI